ncbi:MAG: hypothetical protein CMH56_12095 [Myxococcales bacterium]|nr:hypothetical protein [Myxococcales bacterium]|tara:strand:+ start:2212 stop:2595 length:384 start_codon:yes stop_codon:yes gene_type:complete
MRIPPRRPSGAATGASGASAAQKAEKADKANFAETIGEKDEDEGQSDQARSALMEQLEALAAAVADGSATKEEASRKFAGMVINERFGQINKGKGAASMEEAIGNMVENDPNFVNRLHNQLRKISKS